MFWKYILNPSTVKSNWTFVSFADFSDENIYKCHSIFFKTFYKLYYFWWVNPFSPKIVLFNYNTYSIGITTTKKVGNIF